MVVYGLVMCGLEFWVRLCGVLSCLVWQGLVMISRLCDVGYCLVGQGIVRLCKPTFFNTRV